MGLQFNTAATQQGWATSGTNAQSPATSTQQAGPRALLFGDNIQSSGGSALSFLYVQDMGAPILPAPKTSEGGNLFFNNGSSPGTAQQRSSEGRDALSSYESAYLNTFDGILEQAVQQNGLSEKQADQIVFAAMMGIPIPDNPELNQVLADIQSRVAAQMNQTLGADSSGQTPPSLSDIQSRAKSDFQNSLGNAFDGAFQKALQSFAEANGLTSSQLAQLEYAHYNPDAPISPDVKQLLDKVNSQALEQMGPQWGIPEGFVPQANNTQFNATVNFNYEQAFKDTLNNADLSQLSGQLGISPDALKGIMNYIHGQTQEAGSMDPKALGLANKSQLQQVIQMMQQLESNAAGEIAGFSGLPDGVVPEGNPNSFQNTLDGRVLQEFQFDLKNQTPPLSQQQIAQVLNAAQNPSDPSISPETLTILNKVFAQAVSEVSSEYNVPPAWTPNVSSLQNLSTQGPDIKMANAGIQFANDALNMAVKYLNPNNPNDAALINVIKSVQVALSNLKATIAEMEMQNAQMQSKTSQAQSQANLYKIQLQNEKLQKAQEQAQKMKPLMAFMKIFGPIFKALMAVVFAMFFPIGTMLAASMFQDISTGGKQNFLTDMFTKIMQDLPQPANIAVSASVMWAMSACGSVPNPMVFMQIFFENSQILQGVSKMCGADESQAQMVNMIAQTVAQITVMIIMTIVTGGAAGAALAGEISSAITQVTIQVLQTVLEGVEKLAEALEDIGGIASKVAELLEKFADQIMSKIEKLTEVVEKLEQASEVIEQIENAKSALDSVEEGSEAANQIAEEIETLNESLKEINESIKELGGTALDNIRKGLSAGTTVAKVATTGVQSAVSIMQAQLDKFNAEMDAQIEELENLVKILTATLQKLMEGMSGMASWTADIGQQQSHMWQGLSQTMTAIANSTRS